VKNNICVSESSNVYLVLSKQNRQMLYEIDNTSGVCICPHGKSGRCRNTKLQCLALGQRSYSSTCFIPAVNLCHDHVGQENPGSTFVQGRQWRHTRISSMTWPNSKQMPHSAKPWNRCVIAWMLGWLPTPTNFWRPPVKWHSVPTSQNH